MATSIQIQTEALSRAVNGQSLTNYPAIYQGFIAKGIPADEIKPRENIFSFNAWKAIGRHVKRGEHGVKITTFREVSKKDSENPDKKKHFRMPWTVTVFHISQTEPIQPKAS